MHFPGLSKLHFVVCIYNCLCKTLKYAESDLNKKADTGFPLNYFVIPRKDEKMLKSSEEGRGKVAGSQDHPH